MTSATIATLGGVLGALAVGLGAFGAHGLREQLTPARLETWQTAAHYHLVHALALVALAALAPTLGPGAAQRVAIAWLAGVLIFSGSLYALCLTDIRVLGAITPFGGVSLIVGWGLLAWSASGRT